MLLKPEQKGPQSRKGRSEKASKKRRHLSEALMGSANQVSREDRSNQTEGAHVQRPGDQRQCGVLEDLSIVHHGGV